MNKIVALTLTASIALASLTGCAAKDAQQKETNVSGISNSEENDNRDNDSQYQDPENIVFEDDKSATIDLPVDDIKVTFDGKELMPGRDTAEEIKTSFPDTFTDNSRFKYNSKQFEIVGCADANIIPQNWKGMSKEFVNQYYEQGNTGSYKEGNRLACYISTTGKAVVPYKRILIRQHI